MRKRKRGAFRKIKKSCLFCGEGLTLNNTRDIKRKKFCSRSCAGKWKIKYTDFGRKGVSFSEETKRKISETVKKQYANGRISVGWRKYIPRRRKTGRGYVHLGTRREHAVLMEKKLGRKLLPNEVVHHIDEDKANNSLGNLIVMTRSSHIRLHSKLRWQRYATVD
jgi:hypothetical protein